MSGHDLGWAMEAPGEAPWGAAAGPARPPTPGVAIQLCIALSHYYENRYMH